MSKPLIINNLNVLPHAQNLAEGSIDKLDGEGVKQIIGIRRALGGSRYGHGYNNINSTGVRDEKFGKIKKNVIRNAHAPKPSRLTIQSYLTKSKMHLQDLLKKVL